MKKAAIMVLLLSGVCAVRVQAQDTSVPAVPEQAPAPAPAPTTPAEYDPRVPAKMEFSGGFVYRSYSPNSSTNVHLNGGYVSAEYNIYSRLGAVVEGTGTMLNQGSQSAGTARRLAIFSGLGGAQLYPFRHRKVTPFGHVLAGEGYYNLHAPAFGGFPSKTITSTGLTYEFGGGLDWRINPHWAIRVIEGDYMISKFYGSQIGNPRQSGYRVSFGIVYLLGKK
jgi:hypothetical protein